MCWQRRRVANSRHLLNILARRSGPQNGARASPRRTALHREDFGGIFYNAEDLRFLDRACAISKSWRIRSNTRWPALRSSFQLHCAHSVLPEEAASGRFHGFRQFVARHLTANQTGAICGSPSKNIFWSRRKRSIGWCSITGVGIRSGMPMCFRSIRRGSIWFIWILLRCRAPTTTAT